MRTTQCRLRERNSPEACPPQAERLAGSTDASPCSSETRNSRSSNHTKSTYEPTDQRTSLKPRFSFLVHFFPKRKRKSLKFGPKSCCNPKWTKATGFLKLCSNKDFKSEDDTQAIIIQKPYVSSVIRES